MSKTDRDFFDIANGAYEGLQIGDRIKGLDNNKYEVASILNNPDENGAEGIAVVPIMLIK